jgi:hypothetical protein
MDAQNQALAYEKEKDAQRKAEYDQAKAQFEQQQAFNWKIKQGVLARYGVKLPDMPAGPSQGAPGRPPVTLGTIAGPARGMMPSNATQDAPPPGVAPQGPMQAPTLEGWEDWRKYNAAV